MSVVPSSTQQVHPSTSITRYPSLRRAVDPTHSWSECKRVRPDVVEADGRLLALRCKQYRARIGQIADPEVALGGVRRR